VHIAGLFGRVTVFCVHFALTALLRADETSFCELSYSHLSPEFPAAKQCVLYPLSSCDSFWGLAV
jgi:hypothetical protein